MCWVECVDVGCVAPRATDMLHHIQVPEVHRISSQHCSSIFNVPQVLAPSAAALERAVELCELAAEPPAAGKVFRCGCSSTSVSQVTWLLAC